MWVTLYLKGVHKTDLTLVMNIEVFMHVYDNCHSLSYVIFNAKMTLFERSLLWARVRSNNVIFALK